MFCLVAASRGGGLVARMEIRRRTPVRRLNVGCLKRPSTFSPFRGIVRLPVRTTTTTGFSCHTSLCRCFVSRGGRRRDHRRGNKEWSDRRSSNLSARHERFGRLEQSSSPSRSRVYICTPWLRKEGERKITRYNNRVGAPTNDRSRQVDERIVGMEIEI